jgi:hypothetical protein
MIYFNFYKLTIGEKMNSININYSSIPFTSYNGFYAPVPPKTFSEKAYSAFPSASEEDKSDPAFTRVIRELNPSSESQPDSMFLLTLPVELQDHIFKFLEPRDLLKCLPTCKQFHVLAGEVLANKAIVSLSLDLGKLEKQINLRLAENKSKGLMLIQEINETLKQLSSFKAYCILLRMYKVESAEKMEIDSIAKENLADEKMEKIDLTLNSIASLQKACQAKLKEIQKQNAVNLVNLENRVTAVALRIFKNPNNFRF